MVVSQGYYREYHGCQVKDIIENTMVAKSRILKRITWLPSQGYYREYHGCQVKDIKENTMGAKSRIL
jgi:hypothetical protein